MRKGFTGRHCPKCNGNVFVDQDGSSDNKEDHHGWYEWCLQCGYTHYLQPAPVLKEFKAMPAMKEPAIA